MIPQIPQVYFGACDRQMETFISHGAFVHNLVYGILFHGDLIIPDIYLYISNHIEALLFEDKFAPNFIRACLRHGALVPAFRSDTGVSFHDNLAEIRKEGIQGVLPKAEDIARILQKFVVGQRLHPVLWPTAPFSKSYKATLERTLLTDTIPGVSPQLENIWEQTKEIRQVVLGTAKTDSLGGFRRGDIYNSILSYLGSGGDRVDDVRVILTQSSHHKSGESVKRLIKWVNYCYYFNHGRMFSLSPSLSALDTLDIQFARHLAELDDEGTAAAIFNQAFDVPCVNDLLTIDPEYIFEVRNSEIGAGYFSALAEWQHDPSKDTSERLLDALDKYTGKLGALYIAKGLSLFNIFHVIVPAGKTRWGSIQKETLGEILKESANQLLLGLGLLSLVGKVAAATYESLPASAREKYGHLFGVGRRLVFDVDPEMTMTVDAVKVATDASFR